VHCGGAAAVVNDFCHGFNCVVILVLVTALEERDIADGDAVDTDVKVIGGYRHADLVSGLED
jgi:hypothetical protein